MNVAALLVFLALSGGPGKLRIDFPKPKSIIEYCDTVSLAFIGDVMMHSPQLRYDHGGFLRDIAPLLSEADFAVAGMEFTLAGQPYTGYPAFSAPDSYLNSIKDAGVDILLTANNHILDKGDAGLERTLRQYEGSIHTGTGRDSLEYYRNNPLIISCKRARIALINFTYGTNLPGRSAWPKVSRMDKAEIARQFAEARRRGADFIIVLPHWGTEYRLKHDASQEEWARWLVGQGADAIVGAHPHVVQDTCHIAGVPVIYSMGNAVSNMSAPNTQLGLAVTLDLVFNPLSGETRVEEPQLHFLWCSRPGGKSGNYNTILVDKYLNHKELWSNPADWRNMMSTLERVRKTTGIGQ